MQWQLRGSPPEKVSHATTVQAVGMQWQLHGNPPEEVLTRLITVLLAGLVPFAAAIALAVARASFSQLYDPRWKHLWQRSKQ